MSPYRVIDDPRSIRLNDLRKMPVDVRRYRGRRVPENIGYNLRRDAETVHQGSESGPPWRAIEPLRIWLADDMNGEKILDALKHRLDVIENDGELPDTAEAATEYAKAVADVLEMEE